MSEVETAGETMSEVSQACDLAGSQGGSIVLSRDIRTGSRATHCRSLVIRHVKVFVLLTAPGPAELSLEPSKVMQGVLKGTSDHAYRTARRPYHRPCMTGFLF